LNPGFSSRVSVRLNVGLSVSGWAGGTDKAMKKVAGTLRTEMPSLGLEAFAQFGAIL
jgi:F0F1-type ATP synthase alpha subunit